MASFFKIYFENIFAHQSATFSNAKKNIIAILFGVITLFSNTIPLFFYITDVRIDLTWIVIFPIFISMAYGPKRGIICGLIGALYPFIFTNNNMAGNVFITLIYVLIMAALGTATNISNKTHANFQFKKAVLIVALFTIFISIFCLVFHSQYFTENLLEQGNTNLSHFGINILTSCIITEVMNIIMMIAIADLLLCLPTIRRVFSLKITKGITSNDKIFVSTSTIFILIISVYLILENLIFISDPNYKTQHGFMFWYTLLFIVIVFCRVIMNYISQKNKIQFTLKKQNNELRIAKTKAIESDNLKSAFLANLSHEIRTPLNAIIGFSDMMISNPVNQLEKEEYFRIIKSNSNQLLSIINDTVEISKIETGQLKPMVTKMHLNKALQELIYSLQINLDNNIQLHLISPNIKSDTIILTDEVKLLQILTNLINNAIKFTKEGSITVKYDKTTNNELLFSVRDTGIGITPEKVKTIFSRFTKIDKNNKGSGLGLSISKAYVDLLGGKINVKSKLNIGSTFYFTIPFKEHKGSKNEKITIEKNKIYTGNKELILIVEDTRINYVLLKQILTANNYQILWAENGLISLDYVKKHNNIDLILMDISMPVMDGYEALNRIQKIAPQIPVIAHTAYALNEDKSKIEAFGFDDFIPKPTNKNELLKKVKHYIKATNKTNSKAC